MDKVARSRWRAPRLQACRAQPTPPRIDCSGARLEGYEHCTVRVDDYLRCLSDWSDSATCDYAGQVLPQPDSCAVVVDACPSLYLGDPEAMPIEPCDEANAPLRKDEDDDIRGLDPCRPVPARLVVLGDSIAACTGLPDDADCAPELLADSLRETMAPELRYEFHAQPGADMAGAIARQQEVEPGPGHVLVWFFAGGNDLNSCATAGPLGAPSCVQALADAGPVC